MIEIIQNGKDKKYKATCPKCDTDIAYKKEDICKKNRNVENKDLYRIHPKYYKNYNSLKIIEEYVSCPCCGQSIVISEYVKQFNKRVGVEEL